MAKFNLKKAILENKATFHSSLTEGQFSWFTQDTDRQIGSEEENTLRAVYMHDNKGNKWVEKRYEGYGEFGGKDYYELLDQMNGGEGSRQAGIDLAFNTTKVNAGEVLFPALVEDPNFNYKTHDFTQEAENDPNQSWYQEPEDEDEYIMRDDEDDEYLDEVKIEEGLTPLQQYVYDFESDVSGEDFAEEEKENIMNLKTVGDVKKYYADYRGWMDDSSLREMLMDLLMDLSSEFPTLKEDFNKEKSNKQKLIDAGYSESDAEDFADEFEQGGVKVPQKVKDILSEIKPKTKMKKSEFKDKIKEMILAEYERDVDYTDETSGYDFLAEIDAILAEAEEEEEVDAETADAEVETPEGTEDVEVTDTTTTAEVDPNVKAVQDALTQAQAAAQTLGDAKLTDQIGNTITFFTRSHVVDKGAVAEGQEEMSVDAAADKVENAVDDKLEATVNALDDKQKEQLRAGLAKLGITANTDPETIASKIDESLFEAEGDTKTKIANALSDIGGGLMKSLLVPIIPVAIGSMGPGVAAGLVITAGTAGILIALAKALGAEKSMEEGKEEYYKDAESDDAAHINALEKDMKDDKDSSMKIKEVVFPMWQRIK